MQKTTTLTPTLRTLAILGVSLAVLLSYNFMSAAWTAAPANPPANNTEAPINVGSTLQTKSGALVLSGAAGRLAASSSVQSDTFVVGNILAAVSQVRSDLYCDAAGENCFAAASSSVNTMRDVKNLVRFSPPPADNGHQVSTRNITTSLKVADNVTFFSGDKETADFLCQEQMGREYGIWTHIYIPDKSGWEPYPNLAIASINYGALCTNGSSCYSREIPFGQTLECYDLDSDINGLPTVHRQVRTESGISTITR